MSQNLYIIVDVSGSMNELGKIHIQRNLCRYISQIKFIDEKKYLDTKINFYKWSSNISEIDVQEKIGVPELIADGISDLDVLLNFLSNNIYSSKKSFFLIMSDGNFSRDDYKKFEKWKKEQKNPSIFTVAVGADADLIMLKKVSTNNRVYLSENISSAIDGIMFGANEKFAPPASTNQIIIAKSDEIMVVQENWDA